MTAIQRGLSCRSKGVAAGALQEGYPLLVMSFNLIPIIVSRLMSAGMHVDKPS